LAWYNSLAIVHDKRGDSAGQLRLVQQAVEVYEELCADEPDNTLYQTYRGVFLVNFGGTQMRAGACAAEKCSREMKMLPAYPGSPVRTNLRPLAALRV
jgi:hypothetical protein